MPTEVPPNVRRDRLTVKKAEIMLELSEVWQQISEARGAMSTSGRRMPKRDWSDLLSRESQLKAAIARIELDLVKINRDASEQRWTSFVAAQSALARLVYCAKQLADDDDDGNWEQLERALETLQRDHPEYCTAFNV